MDDKNLYWIGPRLSDIKDVEYLFSGAIIFFGNTNKNKDFKVYSLEVKENTRINHNNFKNFELVGNFLISTIKEILKNDNNAFFMFYCDIYVDVEDAIQKRILCNNKILLNLLSDKFKIRNILYPDIETLNSEIAFTKDISYEYLKEKYKSDKYIIQLIRGSGGNSTYFINSKKDNYLIENIQEYECLVSEYIDKAIPLNLHIVISESDTIIYPPSIQIVEHKENKLLYSGADFASVDLLIDKSVKNKIYENCKIIASKLKNLSYKGVLGVDFLIKDDHIYFVEINPRFQASTFILNQALLENSLPSIQHLQKQIFFNEKIDTSVDYNMKINKSFFSILYSENNVNKKFYEEIKLNINSPDSRNSKFNKSNLNLEIINNNVNENYKIQENSNFAYIIFDTPIIYKTLTGHIELVTYLRRLIKSKAKQFINIKKEDYKKIALLKFELITYGSQISKEAKNQLYTSRDFLTIRDGIAGGLEIIAFENIHINIPIKEKFSYISPYKIEFNKDENNYFISCENEYVTEIKIVPLPSFVNKNTKNNTKFEEIGQITTDRLGISPFIGCKYQNKNSCKFCEIGNYEKNTINKLEDIEELLKECKNIDQMKHILVSGGTPFNDDFEYFIKVLNLIKKNSNLKTYQMIEPVDNSFIKKLFDNGLDEIAFNIEIYDRNIAKEIMPKKSDISLEEYLRALKYATTLWGKNGNVRSILIVGLEPIKSTLKGVEELVKLGVMPILSPFRPIANTPLENYSPPSSDLLFEVWDKSQQIAENYGMTLGPFCIACKNNTISLPINEKYLYY